ncbi:MAG: DUF11 domain-containing protein, partial [Eggerthellaceae bacterium]|nr:DUF11 domain-containing protein [Eggerthellaceae bacterium]
MVQKKNSLWQRFVSMVAAISLALSGVSSVAYADQSASAGNGPYPPQSKYTDQVFWWTADKALELFSAGGPYTSKDEVTLPDGSKLEVECGINNLDGFLISKIPTAIESGGWAGDGMAWMHSSGTTGDGNTLVNGLMSGREDATPLRDILKGNLDKYWQYAYENNAYDTPDNPYYSWYKLAIDTGGKFFDTRQSEDDEQNGVGYYDPNGADGDINAFYEAWENEPLKYGDGQSDYFGYVTGVQLPVDTSFDVSCSVKLNGINIPFSYVVGDAESNGTGKVGENLESTAGDITNPDPNSSYYKDKEWFDLTANGNNPTWRILEQYSGCNYSSAVTALGAGSVRMHSDEGECGGNGGLRGKGPASVLIADNTDDLHVKIHNRGAASSSATAISLGVLVAADFGDAPSSYGAAGAVWGPQWESADISTGTHRVSDVTEGQSPNGTAVVLNGDYRVGSTPQDDYYLGSLRDFDRFTGNKMVDTSDGDDTDLDSNPGFDEDSYPNAKNITNDLTVENSKYVYEIDVPCVASTSVPVNGWIDWDNSGTFENGIEHASGVCENGSAHLKWEVPEDQMETKSDVANGFTFMRLRINENPAHSAQPSGVVASEGEVEDYRIKWDTAVDVDKSVSVGKERNGNDIANRATDYIPDTYAKWDVAFTNAGVISFKENKPAVIWDVLDNVLDKSTLLEDTIQVLDKDGNKVGNGRYTENVTFTPTGQTCESNASIQEGDFYADGVWIADSCSIGQDSGINKVVVWEGPLPAGETYHLTFLTQLTTYGNNGNLGNRAYSTNHLGHDARADVRMPKLELEKTAESDGDIDNIQVGDTITYTIRIRNVGPGDVRYDANVVDDISDVLDDAEWVGFVQSPQSGSLDFSLAQKKIAWSPSSSTPLNAGGSVTFKYAVKYSRPSQGGDKNLVNHAKVPEGYGDSEVTTEHKIKTPEIKVHKEKKSGVIKKNGDVTYTITVKNTGEGAAHHVTVDDVPGAAFANSFTWSNQTQGTAQENRWDVGTLEPGQSATVDVTMKVSGDFNPATDKAINFALAGSDETPVPGGSGIYDEEDNPTGIRSNNDVDGDDDQGDYVVDEGTELKIDKQLNADSAKGARVGSEITYTITAKNTGSAKGKNVSVTEKPGTGLSLVSITPDNGVGSVNGAVWTIGDMEPGQTETATVTMRITSLRNGQVYNDAVIQDDDHSVPNRFTPTPNDDIDSDGDQGDREYLRFPILGVEKVRADSDKVAQIGDTITYTITAKNTGAAAAEGVEVADTLAGGAELVSIQPADSNDSVEGSTWKIASLEAGATKTATVTVRVTDGSAITNTATISNEDYPADVNPSAVVETEFAKRTIHYWYLQEDGTPASTDVVQLAEFTRNGTTPAGGNTTWGDWSEPNKFEAVQSPEIEGWNADRDTIAQITPQRGDDIVEHVIYTPEPPVGTPDETYGGKDQPQTGTPTFEVTTPTTPDGSDNEIVKIELLDA